MPQLDKVTFITQLFWLIIFFSLLFWYVNYILVPTISKNLKYRKLLLGKYQSTVNSIEDKQNNILKDFDTHIIYFITKMYSSFKHEVLEQEKFLNDKLFIKNISKESSISNIFNNYKYNHNIYSLRKGCI